MLDDLRRSASDDFGDFRNDNDDDFGGEVDVPEGSARNNRFLGMTAVERMFISIFVFLTTLVLGFALLLQFGRIQL